MKEHELTELMLRYAISNLRTASYYTCAGCEEIDWRIGELKKKLKKIKNGKKITFKTLD
jgi:hypothetical protein